MTVEEAEAAERAVFKAIADLGEVELAAVKAWVAGGCEGVRPRPDDEARRVLTDRLSAAIVAREAAAQRSRPASESFESASKENV